MATNTFTLENTAGTLTATLRYVRAGVMPQKDKSFTKQKLADGSYTYDYPSTPIKRRWLFSVDAEDAGDALLSTLNSLFALTENLLLHLDLDPTIFTADGAESNISVHFESYQPTHEVASQFGYSLELQEV